MARDRWLLQKAASFHAMCCLLIAVTHHVSLVLATKDLIGWQGETHTVSDDVEDTNAAAEAEELMKLRSSLAGKIGPQAGGSPATRHDVTHHDAVVTTSFVVGPKPKHPSHHASTIVELDSPKHLLVAWFSGAFEGRPDVGIWVSRTKDGGKTWSEMVEVAPPVRGTPMWNPVLYYHPHSDEAGKAQVVLFYKTGDHPRHWKGLLRRSFDLGHTWSEAQPLPHGALGPIKNKPILAPDGVTLLCPSSVEGGARGKVWHATIERTRDLGKTWLPPIEKIELEGKVIQPTLYLDSNDGVRMLARTRLRYMAASKGAIPMPRDDSASAASASASHANATLQLATLPCPNTGLDAVRLRDGRIFLVYNHSFKTGMAGRGVLGVALSLDDGATWTRSSLTLEDSGGRVREYSYPAVIESSDGLVHVLYTWRRANVRHIVVDVSKLSPKIHARG
ncbi:sialidase [Pycnococcus provasolii]